MAKGKKTSKSSKQYYEKNHKSAIWRKNKSAKLAKHLKKHSNDIQAAKALQDNDFTCRKKPNTKVWTASKKYYAKLLKPTVSKAVKVSRSKNFFSIGERGHLSKWRH